MVVWVVFERRGILGDVWVLTSLQTRVFCGDYW